jgi:hypothetical protein
MVLIPIITNSAQGSTAAAMYKEDVYFAFYKDINHFVFTNPPSPNFTNPSFPGFDTLYTNDYDIVDMTVVLIDNT